MSLGTQIIADLSMITTDLSGQQKAPRTSNASRGRSQKTNSLGL
jgi:hypothetical protein